MVGVNVQSGNFAMSLLPVVVTFGYHGGVGGRADLSGISHLKSVS